MNNADQSSNGQAAIHHPTIEQSSAYFQFEREEMLAFVPLEYKTVLEIGCAEGRFKSLLSTDCEYWGVEYDSHAASIAKARLHSVLLGKYTDIEDQLPNDYFDLIICNDVIEHMPDEAAFLRSIKSKMSGHGTIVISLPNVRYIKNLYELLVKKNWRYRDAGILDRTHLRFFTNKSIQHAMQSAGFNITQMHGINNAIRSQSKLKKLVQCLIYLPLAIIFGKDTLFMQFGLSAQKSPKD